MLEITRGRVPRIIGESCLAATLSLSAGFAPAIAAATPSSTAMQSPTPTPTAGQEVTDIVLPKLGESDTEGTVVRWLKKPGDAVDADEPVVEVESTKVNIEVVAPASGVLREIVVQEGETAAIGDTLGIIGPKAESS
ncbi:lipoyl domain-containing protein [Spongiactinospora sp. TRM90649]|uniref:lipoyl domain-containing protein n=1 Tax=Spongiactinospora sp. TRM90649 TaxID=3031114 RepID=UPI0023F9790B|nr:lipoyl domain-containing protein [Spongiactinospora sp. TRM90649]MDF5752660.1 lipoyl domain-containing protein [Spongiactinospora sp. TRM90649]